MHPTFVISDAFSPVILSEAKDLLFAGTANISAGAHRGAARHVHHTDEGGRRCEPERTVMTDVPYGILLPAGGRERAHERDLRLRGSFSAKDVNCFLALALS
jgi:hypothetical protein